MPKDTNENATKRYTTKTSIAIVIGNMVGTGVFTSLGFQLLEFDSGFLLLVLWLIGGITALAGALTYSELAARLPNSGGEYNYLKEIFHPSLGFVAGWVSVTIGFSAPVALVAITFGTYLSAAIDGINSTLAGIALIVAATVLHVTNYATSSGFQTIFTFLKVLLIATFCGVAWFAAPEIQPISFVPVQSDFALLLSGGFAVALIFVNYAYLGWNATTYVAEEFDNPIRAISSALLFGTLIVTALYLMLNFTFLSVAPISALKGELEVGYIASQYAFGKQGALVMVIILAFLLISTISAMTLAGPRALHRIGRDFSILRWLGRTNRHGLPVAAICFQSALALIFVVTSSFEMILVLTGFTLSLCSFVAALGAIWLRIRNGKPDNFRMPLYPLPPVIFLAITGWTLVYVLFERPLEGMVSIGLIGSGLLLYWLCTYSGARLQ